MSSADQQRVTTAADPAAVALLPEDVRSGGRLVVAGGFAGGGLPPLGFTADDDKTPIGIDVYLGPNQTATYRVATTGQTEIVGTVSSSFAIDGKVAVLTKKHNGLVKALAAATDAAIADGSSAEVLNRWGLGAEAVSKAEVNPPGLPVPKTTG